MAQDGSLTGVRSKIGIGLLIASVAYLLIAVIATRWPGRPSPANPDDAQQVAHGRLIYEQSCAACHGNRLEGQPNWRERLPSGRMPAPPHDASGHTWHHPDAVLFGITKHGLVPGKYAPPGYLGDMPAFGGTLSDEDIWAVLAYVKSSWPQDIRKAQREITLKSDRR